MAHKKHVIEFEHRILLTHRDHTVVQVIKGSEIYRHEYSSDKSLETDCHIICSSMETYKNEHRKKFEHKNIWTEAYKYRDASIEYV